MDLTLLLLIGGLGILSTFGMIEFFRYFYDKENK